MTRFLIALCCLVTACEATPKKAGDDGTKDESSDDAKRKKGKKDKASKSSIVDRKKLAEVDNAIFDRMAMLIDKPKVEDVFPEKPYRVDLHNHDGSSRVTGGDLFVTRASVDFDRDGKWDEKWRFELEGGTSVTYRDASPKDNGKMTATYHLVDGSERWVKGKRKTSTKAASCKLTGIAACTRCVDKLCKAELTACCGNAKCKPALAALSKCLAAQKAQTAGMVGCWDNFQVGGGLDPTPSLRECTTKHESKPDCAKCVVP